MNEGQATIEGTSYQLAPPFFVLATQNPVEFHGTYPLPEAQLDRFLVQLDLGYPDADTEVGILYSQVDRHPLEDIDVALTSQDVLNLQQQVRQVTVDESVSHYIIHLVQATRNETRLKLGVSPRGSLMLFRATQAAAFAAGRDYALPDDVQCMAPHVLAHRVILTSKARYGSSTKQGILRELIQQVKVPT